MSDGRLVIYAIMLAAHLGLGVMLFGTGRPLLEYLLIAVVVTNGLFLVTSQE